MPHPNEQIKQETGRYRKQEGHDGQKAEEIPRSGESRSLPEVLAESRREPSVQATAVYQSPGDAALKVSASTQN